MAAYSPPFTLTHAMLSRVAEIAELVGQWRSTQSSQVPMLRRENRIRTIQASLAIEHNTLSLEQVTVVIDGKPVLGLPREIQEVRNAFAAYEAMSAWAPTSSADLLRAHGRLMHGLCDDAGQWRSSGVGIYRGEQLVHMAPPATQVPRLMEQLMQWLAETEAHPLIASCALHYELEFIHPFSDGNGRMGRLWQTVILSRWQPVMAFLPVGFGVALPLLASRKTARARCSLKTATAGCSVRCFWTIRTLSMISPLSDRRSHSPCLAMNS